MKFHQMNYEVHLFITWDLVLLWLFWWIWSSDVCINMSSATCCLPREIVCRMSLPILVCVKSSATFKVKATKFGHRICRPENRNFAFLTILTCRVFTIWLHSFWFIASILHLGTGHVGFEMWNKRKGIISWLQRRMRVVGLTWEGGLARKAEKKTAQRKMPGMKTDATSPGGQPGLVCTIY